MSSAPTAPSSHRDLLPILRPECTLVARGHASLAGAETDGTGVYRVMRTESVRRCGYCTRHQCTSQPGPDGLSVCFQGVAAALGPDAAARMVLADHRRFPDLEVPDPPPCDEPGMIQVYLVYGRADGRWHTGVHRRMTAARAAGCTLCPADRCTAQELPDGTSACLQVFDGRVDPSAAALRRVPASEAGPAARGRAVP